MMMINPHDMLCMLVLGFTLFSSQWSIVASQTLTCDEVTSVATSMLTQVTENCALDRSLCGASSLCNTECLDGGDSLQNTCADTCGYTLGEFFVERAFTATIGYGYLGTTPMLVTTFAFTHTFTAGADGTMAYVYEGTIDDGQLVPVFGRECIFKFNGNTCLCEQRYCDENKVPENSAHYIDCSSVEGGSIINLCLGYPAITTDSSPMDILFWLPDILCSGTLNSPDSATGSIATPSPVASTTSSPVLAEGMTPIPVSVSATTASPIVDGLSTGTGMTMPPATDLTTPDTTQVPKASGAAASSSLSSALAGVLFWVFFFVQAIA